MAEPRVPAFAKKIDFGEFRHGKRNFSPRNTRKDTKRSDDDSLPLELRIVAEIDQEAVAMTGGVEVIKNLGAVFIGESGDGLQFNDDFRHGSIPWSFVCFVGNLQRNSQS